MRGSVSALERVSVRVRACACVGVRVELNFVFDRCYVRAIFLYEISLYYLYYLYARMSILFKFT